MFHDTLVSFAERRDIFINENKNYNDKNKMYNIMNTIQNNYSNMLKRLQIRKSFSNFVITDYSITLIVYTLTAEFLPDKFNIELSDYFNIILSIVVLTYSLIITNAKCSDCIQATERVLNEVKAKKRELTDDNFAENIRNIKILCQKQNSVRK